MADIWREWRENGGKVIASLQIAHKKAYIAGNERAKRVQSGQLPCNNKSDLQYK
jgi:hypothetical protein